MNIEKKLENFFDKDQEEQDIILTEIAGVYISSQIKMGKNYRQILAQLDKDIETSIKTDKFELVEAFKKIKKSFTDIINESLQDIN
jgi:hypothetical protein